MSSKIFVSWIGLSSTTALVIVLFSLKVSPSLSEKLNSTVFCEKALAIVFELFIVMVVPLIPLIISPLLKPAMSAGDPSLTFSIYNIKFSVSVIRTNGERLIPKEVEIPWKACCWTI